MDRVKIVNIVGARPQFVKMALIAEASKLFSELRFCIVHTGQHYDRNMSDIFFRDLNIPKPAYNLNVGSDSHTGQIGKMIQGLGKILSEQSPDIVFVYGDTNSTLAGALASAKMNIPLAHIEAGLRSFNKTMPEEINRIVTDRVSDILFCPTKTAVTNLRREGISKRVFYVGDVMIDMLVRYSTISRKKSRILNAVNQRPGDYYLATVHRAYNTDDIERLKRLIKVFGSLDRRVVFPIHPRTRKALSNHRIAIPSNVLMLDPVSYIDMLMLEMNARVILTDSGGVQKEAHFFRVPCVTLREETEWVETVETGWNILAGVDQNKILKALRHFEKHRFLKIRKISGNNSSSARKILNITLNYLENRQ
jgi:UDP-N-acetylglucosamine 2-epimerase